MAGEAFGLTPFYAPNSGDCPDCAADTEYVDQVLAQLVDEQVIAAVEITYQGQVGTRYRLITTR